MRLQYLRLEQEKTFDMLEALVALGLAGNVIQLVQFSADLVKQTVEIRRGGDSPPLLELKHVTANSVQQAEAIQAQLVPRPGQPPLTGQDLVSTNASF